MVLAYQDVDGSHIKGLPHQRILRSVAESLFDRRIPIDHVHTDRQGEEG
jgi:hypothetical protein